jgi:hypothetical protein
MTDGGTGVLASACARADKMPVPSPDFQESTDACGSDMMGRMRRPQFSLGGLLLLVACVCVGLRLLIGVYVDLGWSIGTDYWFLEACGIGLIGAALGIPFKRPVVAGVVAFVGFIAFAFLWYSF